jgi:hypothetical protein
LQQHSLIVLSIAFFLALNGCAIVSATSAIARNKDKEKAVDRQTLLAIDEALVK